MSNFRRSSTRWLRGVRVTAVAPSGLVPGNFAALAANSINEYQMVGGSHPYPYGLTCNRTGFGGATASEIYISQRSVHNLRAIGSAWQKFNSITGTAGSITTRWNYNARGLLAYKPYADNKDSGGPNATGGRSNTRVWARTAQATKAATHPAENA